MRHIQYTTESINRALEIHQTAGRIKSWTYYPGDSKTREQWVIVGNGLSVDPGYMDCSKSQIKALIFGLASAGFADS